jgi:hypothetical protein
LPADHRGDKGGSLQTLNDSRYRFIEEEPRGQYRVRGLQASEGRILRDLFRNSRAGEDA